MAINKQRLEKIKARQDVMAGIAGDVKKKLVEGATKPEFITKLTVQGLLMLLEQEVTVRCRKEDAAKVQGCLQSAQTQYQDIIQRETQQIKTVNLKMDEKNLPSGSGGADGATCMGGVVLSCQNGRISIDN